jgi:hypothetical protein
MDADIIQQPPRLVARRRVDFCLSLNSTRALSESQVKVESPRHRRTISEPASSTLVGYAIYASGEIGLSCFLNITIHKNSPFH